MRHQNKARSIIFHLYYFWVNNYKILGLGQYVLSVCPALPQVFLCNIIFTIFVRVVSVFSALFPLFIVFE